MPGCISSALQEYHTISIELMVRANTALGDEIYVVGEVCCARCACWTRSNCSHHMRSCSRRNSVCGTRSARSNCPPTRKYFRSGRRRCCLAMTQTACDARGRRCVWLLHSSALHTADFHAAHQHSRRPAGRSVHPAIFGPDSTGIPRGTVVSTGASDVGK